MVLPFGHCHGIPYSLACLVRAVKGIWQWSNKQIAERRSVAPPLCMPLSIANALRLGPSCQANTRALRLFTTIGRQLERFKEQ